MASLTFTIDGASTSASYVKLPSASTLTPLPALSPADVWRQRVDTPGQALDPSSGAVCATLLAQIAAQAKLGNGPYVNTTRFSVPVYAAPPATPRVPVVLDRLVGYGPQATALQAQLSKGVPIPPGAQPALPLIGGDHHLALYDPATREYWEFWHLYTATDGSGWHCGWGAYMPDHTQNRGYFGSLSGYTVTNGWGARATSLPLVCGLITPDELAAGSVPHALALAVPSARAYYWSAPAQRTDGNIDRTDASAICEGSRFRIDPALDLTTLGLTPFGLTLALAAQRYGIVVADKTGPGNATTFFCQDPTPNATNPYPALLGGRTPMQALARFPWDRLQLLAMSNPLKHF